MHNHPTTSTTMRTFWWIKTPPLSHFAYTPRFLCIPCLAPLRLACVSAWSASTTNNWQECKGLLQKKSCHCVYFFSWIEKADRSEVWTLRERGNWTQAGPRWRKKHERGRECRLLNPRGLESLTKTHNWHNSVWKKANHLCDNHQGTPWMDRGCGFGAWNDTSHFEGRQHPSPTHLCLSLFYNTVNTRPFFLAFDPLFHLPWENDPYVSGLSKAISGTHCHISSYRPLPLSSPTMYLN